MSINFLLDLRLSLCGLRLLALLNCLHGCLSDKLHHLPHLLRCFGKLFCHLLRCH